MLSKEEFKKRILQIPGVKDDGQGNFTGIRILTPAERKERMDAKEGDMTLPFDQAAERYFTPPEKEAEMAEKCWADMTTQERAQSVYDDLWEAVCSLDFLVSTLENEKELLDRNAMGWRRDIMRLEAARLLVEDCQCTIEERFKITKVSYLEDEGED